MPPQQIWKPSFFAARKVASLSAAVCVVQRDGKRDGAVSRLQWTRCSPAALSFARSSSERSPSEAQSPIFGAAWRIAFNATQTFSTSSWESVRPEVTMPILSAPLAAAPFAALTHASVPTQPYVSQPVFQCADCAHHLQFSEHRPERALMIEQKSNRFSTQLSVVSCARSRSSSLRSGFRSATASSLSIPSDIAYIASKPCGVVAALSATFANGGDKNLARRR